LVAAGKKAALPAAIIGTLGKVFKCTTLWAIERRKDDVLFFVQLDLLREREIGYCKDFPRQRDHPLKVGSPRQNVFTKLGHEGRPHTAEKF